MDPKAAADALMTEHPQEWVGAFVSELLNDLRAEDLSDAMRQLDLSDAQAADLFGVTRQAVTKWRKEGIPAERQSDVWDFVDAVRVLSRYLRPERMVAAVRRKNAQGESLLDVGLTQSIAQMRAQIEATLDLRRVAP